MEEKKLITGSFDIGGKFPSKARGSMQVLDQGEISFAPQ